MLGLRRHFLPRVSLATEFGFVGAGNTGQGKGDITWEAETISHIFWRPITKMLQRDNRKLPVHHLFLQTNLVGGDIEKGVSIAINLTTS